MPNRVSEPRFKESARPRRFFELKALHTTRSRDPAHDTLVHCHVETIG